MQEDIRFYCGIGEKNFNHHPVYTGPYACVSPVCGPTEKKRGHAYPTPRKNGVAVPTQARVLQDSGAFSDACLGSEERNMFVLQQSRLSFKDALIRQEQHAEEFGYTHQIEARASYDVLIDETWTTDEATGLVSRAKKRWSESDAEDAVKITVAAASYLHRHRNGLACVMSAQGVSAQQYLKCAQNVVPFIEDGDIFGLGGWCILGRMRSLMPMFRETMQLVIPFLGKAGVKRAHIWGVCYAPALGELLYLCDQQGIDLSVDSVGPTTRPIKKEDKTAPYATWGYASWYDSKYPVPPILESCRQLNIFGEKEPTCGPGTRCRGLERARHVALTSQWFAEFRSREPQYYQSTPIKKPTHRQISLLEEVI